MVTQLLHTSSVSGCIRDYKQTEKELIKRWQGVYRVFWAGEGHRPTEVPTQPRPQLSTAVAPTHFIL